MTETTPTRTATAKAVAPLIVVNSLAVYGQLAYAYESIAPAAWPSWARLVLAIGFAVAVESVALYVGWHAHDALMLKSHATARYLRRCSYAIALAAAAMNYSHFAAGDLRHPTTAAYAFALLSLLSPWMWGLHTRRMARVQLLKERRADEAGVEFSSARRRMFPILTFKASRYAMMHNITDPADAWTKFLASREPVPSVQPVPVPSVPVPSVPRPRVAPTSGGPAIGWDLDKVVRLVQEGRPDEYIQSGHAVSAKTLQRTRRVVRAVASGQADEDIVRGDITAKFVGLVRAAMEVTA